MKQTEIVCISKWRKGNEVSFVHSERKAGDRVARFWFTCHNPFPCLYMMSTWVVVQKWLKEAGWTRETYSVISFKNVTKDDKTGEIIDQFINTYRYIPVNS